jgi:hypothetical protein
MSTLGKKIVAAIFATAMLLGVGVSQATPASAALPIEYGLTDKASCKPPGYALSTYWVVTYDRDPNNGQVRLTKIRWQPSLSGMTLSDVKTSNQGSWQIGSGTYNVTGSWVNSFSWSGETRYLPLGNCKANGGTVS